jgi:predicted TIM-barrel fold metal-dependent hydrolase
MITEYPLEHRRYDQSEYEPFWAAAEALGLPLSAHAPTGQDPWGRRQDIARRQ